MSLLPAIRQAWRAVSAMRGVAAAIILCLALGIGANTAIFSVASPLLLRPLPYDDPERLVILWNRSPGLGIVEDWFSTAQYFDIRGSGAFADVALAIGGNDNLTGGGRARTHRHDPRVVEPAADARRASCARAPLHHRRGSGGRGGHGAARARHVAASLRR